LYWHYASSEAGADMPRMGAAWRSDPTADACLKDFKTQHWAAIRI